ncbi:M20/M25/M40 family metallo-hydrolase [Tahibacter amnicola]|uniref:M20/M25/M40 family metallo-hydrolase n=1 Tax=Tahibacter amnicola TaxID=2976241 RepID=A0ABY6BKV0_9GAMM|nr:M20/M25/M40 family metallo-hydrolase [Tahibacter amnicola]UXI70529.1 M20/M25/M40 family metallo-hydrolase [Tahibacter amnicola]
MRLRQSVLGLGMVLLGIGAAAGASAEDGYAPDSVVRPDVSAEDAPMFIVTAQSTFRHIGTFARRAEARRDSLGTPLVIAETTLAELGAISQHVHETEHRCGGYFAFTTRSEAEAFIAADQSSKAIHAQRGGIYTVDNGATVNPWLPEVSADNIKATITHLSSYQNRYYASGTGRQAAEWIRDTWQALAAGRTDVTAELYTGCVTCSTQPSVILTVQGTELPGEVVVLGAHLDSITSAGGGNSQVAPGADDDASGIATLTEVIRIGLANGWRPRRTVKFMGYAAEEVGLRGSASIASRFRAEAVNVVGVLQLDMTNYKSGNVADMKVITDFSNTQMKGFLVALFDAYLAPLGLTRGEYTCGYGCSDHASWTTNGFPSAMMFEAGDSTGYFGRIHSNGDTLANMENSAVNSAKFAKLGLAFLGELGKTYSGGNLAPRANFSFVADQRTVTFTDSSTDVEGAITARTWRFGDGATSSEVNPVRTFAANGTYAVSLTAADEQSATHTKTVRVTATDGTNALANGIPRDGTSALLQARQTFTLVVPDGATDLSFTTTGPGGEDADLKILLGNATLCSAETGSSNESCPIANPPAAGTYTAEVLAYTPLSGFTITGRFTPPPADILFADGFESAAP